MPVTTRAARRRAGSAAGAAAVLAVLVATALPGPAAAVERDPRVDPAATAESPIDVAVVVPLTVPLEAPSLLDAETLTEYVDDDGTLTRQLDALEAAGAGVTVALDPRIVVSIRVLGTAVPAEVADWAARLESLDAESFALPYADADVAGLASAGRLDVASPLGFGFAVDPGRFGPAPSPTPTPDAESPAPEPSATPSAEATPGATATPDDDAPPPLPTDADLTAWEHELADVVWAPPASLTPEGLARLADAGTARLLVSASDVAATDAAPVSLAGIPAALLDPQLSALASAAAASAPATAADALESLVSNLGARTGAPVTLALDRVASEAPSRLPAVLSALEADPRIRVVGLSSVFAGDPIPAELSATADPERLALLERLATALDEESRFATVVVDTAAFRAERRLDFLASIASGLLERGDAATEAAEEFLARSAEIVTSVRLVEGSDVLGLSGSIGLPVTVSNALDVAVEVVVSARPLRPLLRIDGGSVSQVIEPGSSHTVYIPARAVTNGEVSVLLSLRSPTGVEIGGPGVVRVDLQAQWETVGIVLLVLLGVIFAAGIVRNVVVRVRSRRSRRESADA